MEEALPKLEQLFQPVALPVKHCVTCIGAVQIPPERIACEYSKIEYSNTFSWRTS